MDDHERKLNSYRRASKFTPIVLIALGSLGWVSNELFGPCNTTGACDVGRGVSFTFLAMIAMGVSLLFVARKYKSDEKILKIIAIVPTAILLIYLISLILK